jgi:hypothetical protein
MSGAYFRVTLVVDTADNEKWLIDKGDINELVTPYNSNGRVPGVANRPDPRTAIDLAAKTETSKRLAHIPAIKNKAHISNPALA